MGLGDRVGHELPGRPVIRRVAHDFHIQLEHAERQVQQRAMVADMRPDIIYGQAVAEIAQPFGRFGQLGQMADRLAFREFDDDSRGRDAGLGAGRLKPVQRLWQQQHIEGEIDG